jgi:threonyl-tRNA synthetase
MIHRALFGSIERFFGVLTEHYAGAFPLWLAPVQAIGIAVAEEYEEYLSGVLDLLKAEGLRVQLDASDDRMQKKIRNAAAQKVPVQIIAGEEDRNNGAVSFRFARKSAQQSVRRLLVGAARITVKYSLQTIYEPLRRR